MKVWRIITTDTNQECQSKSTRQTKLDRFEIKSR